MKIRDDYPIYLNPTNAELLELAESQWDSLRVMECDDTLVIASGYGNTHETLVQYYKKHMGGGKTKKRWNSYTQSEEEVYVCRCIPDWNPFIFFHDRTGIMLCNLGDVSGPDRALPSRWRKEFSVERVKQFRQIAELSGLEAI